MIITFPYLKDEDYQCMASQVNEEIKSVMFSMSPREALGPDSFHAGIYQKSWETVGSKVDDFVWKVWVVVNVFAGFSQSNWIRFMEEYS